MADEKEQHTPEMDAALRRRLRWIGTAILTAGLLSAALVYRATPPAGPNPDPLNSGYSKRDLYDMERIGGKSVVLAVELNKGFDSLWHGRRLAGTLVFFSLGGSLVCFFLANRLSGALQAGPGTGAD
jgi:hypothetical protein